MQEWKYSPTDLTLPELVLDPYRCGFDAHTAVSGAEGGEPWGDEDWRVPAQARPAAEEASWPAPEPGQRLPLVMAAADRRRLELQAALIRAGVAPAPGDLHAVEELSALDDIVNDTVRRWIAPY
ncbi:hypothetical protein OOK06_22355 [Streptomyces sp. NBC_00340]|uniref:hypothetical protein n=1 Tax=Streptomyces sp. NBC_00340 TaxID=2975716 RepID=UPI00224D88B8|nr:hypothetical protein [Streptomyces sp. NBC_00340]MCX5134819.1 hypothetical protein [Streptomyces sp. NBC_00340]